MKLTTLEKRAKALCETLIANRGGVVVVEWRKNKLWGMVPVILHRGQVAARATGCGYCKESTVLAGGLCFLLESSKRQDVLACGGAGPGAVIIALAENGWKLEKEASSTNSEIYRLTPCR